LVFVTEVSFWTYGDTVPVVIVRLQGIGCDGAIFSAVFLVDEAGDGRFVAGVFVDAGVVGSVAIEA
jgi:hypothetical protein